MINFIEIKDKLLISNRGMFLVDALNPQGDIGMCGKQDLIDKNIEIIKSINPYIISNQKTCVIENTKGINMVFSPIGKYIICISGTKTNPFDSILFINFKLEDSDINNVCSEMGLSLNKVMQIKNEWIQHYTEDLDVFDLVLVD